MNDKSGNGSYYYEDGTVYEGEWLNDMKNGKGECIFGRNSRYPGAIYRGEFRDD